MVAVARGRVFDFYIRELLDKPINFAMAGFFESDKVASQISMDEAFEHTDLPPEKAGTAYDRRDMARMGQAQEFRRNFSFIPIFGFAAVLMMTWASTLRYAGSDVVMVSRTDAVI